MENTDLTEFPESDTMPIQIPPPDGFHLNYLELLHSLQIDPAVYKNSLNDAKEKEVSRDVKEKSALLIYQITGKDAYKSWLESRGISFLVISQPQLTPGNAKRYYASLAAQCVDAWQSDPVLYFLSNVVDPSPPTSCWALRVLIRQLLAYYSPWPQGTTVYWPNNPGWFDVNHLEGLFKNLLSQFVDSGKTVYVVIQGSGPHEDDDKVAAVCKLLSTFPQPQPGCLGRIKTLLLPPFPASLGQISGNAVFNIGVEKSYNRNIAYNSLPEKLRGEPRYTEKSSDYLGIAPAIMDDHSHSQQPSPYQYQYMSNQTAGQHYNVGLNGTYGASSWNTEVA